jgi:hypothetical protein
MIFPCGGGFGYIRRIPTSRRRRRKWNPVPGVKLGYHALFCTGVCEEMTQAREPEECTLSEDIARERLVKTQKAGKGLEDAMVICDLWRLVIAL